MARDVELAKITAGCFENEATFVHAVEELERELKVDPTLVNCRVHAGIRQPLRQEMRHARARGKEVATTHRSGCLSQVAGHRDDKGNSRM
jgi:hypothetical protein